MHGSSRVKKDSETVGNIENLYGDHDWKGVIRSLFWSLIFFGGALLSNISCLSRQEM